MLRPFREAWADRHLDETLAWSALATNLLVLPGLGSIMVRRRATGVMQAAVALAGTAVTVYWLAAFVRLWIQEGAFPMDGGPDFAFGLVGVGVFGLGWLWSLATSLIVLRAVRSGPAATGSRRS